MLYATHARVRLGHILANLDGVRARVGPGHPILVAVKANAYGHGAVEVATMIAETGRAQWLGVATVPEAVELREAGIELPILKLSHALDDDEAALALVNDVTLAVVDEASAARVARAAAAAGRVADVHLKIDTGMRRIGAAEVDAEAVARLVEADPHLALTGAFTHLPVADTPTHDPYTADQIARFFADVAAIEAAVGRRLALVHAANSAAVLAHPDALGPGRDPATVMVRPGIMAYGSYPDPTTPRTVRLHPGLELITAVSFVKPLAAGDGVGYGLTWVAERDTTIATLPVGYADGFSRLNSSRGRVLIGGRSYPIVGRVCMDQCMVDLGSGATVAAGDEAVLIGRQGDEEISCDEVAALMGTITYEVTCLLTPRVGRVYDLRPPAPLA